jgi:transcriptional regulator with PAS, ATPase and Fis domain
VDLRIIAATNDNLFEMASNGGFRKDLYFRLSVAEVRLPPLRERHQDIVPLCDFILGNLCRKMNRPRPALSKETLALLADYPWPGNIREFENVLEISLLMNRDGAILPEHLPQRVREHRKLSGAAPAVSFVAASNMALSDIEGDLIRNALRDHSGNVARTSRALGISRSTIYRKLRELTADSAAELQGCRGAGG